ncbi:MAG TPA: PQQ-binding-like beta-propeller repeat protein [Rhizomicrobium sp.]|nr:PQQ-binding-like beta-propeller repeat protein [Rhizomicrobium sp.]
MTCSHVRLARVSALAAALASSCLGSAWAAPATISASPVYDHPSAQVGVSGTGFGVSQAVDIYFDTTDVGLAVTNGSGAFNNVPINVPASAVPGQHWITGVQRFKGRAAQTSFDVWTDWAQDKFDRRKKAYNPYENVVGPSNASSLDLDWVYQTGFTDDLVYQPMAVADGVAYGISYDGQIFALDTTTGSPLWYINTGVTFGYSGGVAVSSGALFVCLPGGLEALNASSGQTIWSVPISGCAASPAVANGVVYVGDASDHVYAINASTGGQIWQATVNGADGFIAPAVGDGSVFIASGETIYALDAGSGSSEWSATTGGNIYGTPAIANGKLFVGSYDNNLYAFNACCGGVEWKVNFGSGEFHGAGSPAVGPDPYNPTLVYVPTADGNLTAVSAVTGNIVWQTNLGDGAGPYGAPAVANGVVYVAGGYNGYVYALDASYGTLYWSAADDEYAVFDVILTNGMLFAGADAFAINGGNYPAYKKHRSAPKLSALHPDLRLKPHYGTP